MLPAMNSQSGGNGIIVNQAERRYLSPLALAACSASGWRQDQDVIGRERRVQLGAETVVKANDYGKTAGIRKDNGTLWVYEVDAGE
jgi:hypothetical protein